MKPHEHIATRMHGTGHGSLLPASTDVQSLEKLSVISWLIRGFP